MYMPIWLMWSLAMLMAAMPMSVLLLSRLGRKGRTKKRCAKPLEFNPASACLIDLDFEELELRAIAHAMAQVQMRERWGKDIRFID